MNHVRRSIPSSFTQPARVARRGFTVLELLVVAGILVLLLGIAVAVISNVAYSSERSLAENQLRVGMTAARDAAIRSKSGDAAAVFYFREGRAMIQPCVSVGKMKPPNPSNTEYSEWQTRVWDNAVSTDAAPEYEVFVPVPEVEPIVMPRNWTIRGFAPAGSLHEDDVGRRNGWYEWIAEVDAPLAKVGLWVFPETNFLPSDAEGLLTTAGAGSNMEQQGWRRQTFCVRFEAQTGEVVFGDTKPFLVLDAQEAPYRFDAASPFAVFDVEQQEDTAMAVNRLLSAGGRQRLALLYTGLSADEAIQTLFGTRSTDMILTRPVYSISLTDERRLASAIGLRGLNRDTACMYRRIDPAETPPTTPPGVPLDERLAPTGFASTGTTYGEMMTRISRYITSRPDTWGEQISLEARVYTMSRYAGQLQEVVAGGEGTGQPGAATLAGIR